MRCAATTTIREAHPPRDSEWEIRYRVLGPSAVWKDYTVCEVLTGPEAGQKKVLAVGYFSAALAAVGQGEETAGG